MSDSTGGYQRSRLGRKRPLHPDGTPMSPRERRRVKQVRSKKRAWLDTVAITHIEVTVGWLIVAAVGIVVFAWAAANGAAYFLRGSFPGITIQDSAIAMYRLPQRAIVTASGDFFSWSHAKAIYEMDGAWPDTAERRMAPAFWFWLVFVTETVLMIALFWPLWKILGPRAQDPGWVFALPPPDINPRLNARVAAAAPPPAVKVVDNEGSGVNVVSVRPDSSGGGGGGGTIALVDLGSGPGGGAVSKTVHECSDEEVAQVVNDRVGENEIVLGTLANKVVTTENLHSVLVFGPTQSGKTTTMSAPAIRSWNGPVLAISAKSDLIAQTWDAREANPARTWLFDPSRSSNFGETVGPRSSHGWSPLAAIIDMDRHQYQSDQERETQRWTLARQTAKWMVDAARTHDATGLDGSWYAVAEQLLAPMLLAAAGNNCTISTVMTWIDGGAGEEIEEMLDKLKVPEATAAWHRANSHDTPVLTGGRHILAVILYPYDDPKVLELAERAEVTPDAMFDGRANTLFVLAPTHMERVAPLVTSLVAEFVGSAINRATATVTGRLDHPLLVVLDDALILPHALMDQLASAGAGLGIQLMTVVQDLSQMSKGMTTERAIQLSSDHQTRVSLPGVSDPDTLRYLASLVQGCVILEEAKMQPDDVGTKVVGRAAGDAESALSWIRTLGDGEALCIKGNKSPVRLTRQIPVSFEFDDSADEDSTDDGSREKTRKRRWRGSGSSSRDKPGPFNSAANDREAERYWEAVNQTNRLPENE